MFHIAITGVEYYHIVEEARNRMIDDYTDGENCDKTLTDYVIELATDTVMEKFFGHTKKEWVILPGWTAWEKSDETIRVYLATEKDV